MKTLLCLALYAALVVIAVVVFAGSVYLVASDPSRWPRALFLAAAVVATALLLTSAFINDGRPSAGCSATHLHVSVGCRTSTEYKGSTAQPSSIIYHYEHTYSVGPRNIFTRPNTGSIEEIVRCHHCSKDISLTVHSVKVARRKAVQSYAMVSAYLFGGWSTFFWFYFSISPENSVYLALPGLGGIILSIEIVGDYFNVWISTALDRAANWHVEDHRWFSPDQKALANPFA
jgi:hypothetical protein